MKTKKESRENQPATGRKGKTLLEERPPTKGKPLRNQMAPKGGGML